MAEYVTEISPDEWADKCDEWLFEALCSNGCEGCKLRDGCKEAKDKIKREANAS